MKIEDNLFCFFKTQDGTTIKIDCEDLPKVSIYKWRITMTTFGSPRIVADVRNENGVRRRVTLGRFLISPAPGLRLIRLNHTDPFDYRKSSILAGTIKDQQTCARKIRSETTSQFRGVSYDNGRWRASIQNNSKTIYIGAFDSEEEAALAYEAKAKEIFGVPCFTNFKSDEK